MSRKLLKKNIRRTRKKICISQKGGTFTDLPEKLKDFKFQEPISDQYTMESNVTEFNKLDNNKNVCFINTHGSYFTPHSPIHYFKVPENVIICNLTEISHYVCFPAFQSLNLERQPPDFWDLLFKYRARLSNYTIPRNNKFNYLINSDTGYIHDLFFNSSWFYPNQFCNNIGFEANPSELSSQKMYIRNYQINDAGIKSREDYPPESTGNLQRNLLDICQELSGNGKQNIVIICACMFIPTQGIIINNFLQVKEFDSLHTQKNRIERPSPTAIDSKLQSWKSPPYHVSNKMHIHTDFMESYIQNLAKMYYTDDTGIIEAYDKRYRIIEHIHEHPDQLLSPLLPQYKNLLHSLTFKELIYSLQKIIEGQDEGMAQQIIDTVMTDEFIGSRIFNLSQLFYYILFKFGDISQNAILFNMLSYKILDLEFLNTNFGNLADDKIKMIEILQELDLRSENPNVYYIPTQGPSPPIFGRLNPGETPMYIMVEGSPEIDYSPGDLFDKIVHFKFSDNDNINLNIFRKFGVLEASNIELSLEKCNLPSPDIWNHLKNVRLLNLVYCEFTDSNLVLDLPRLEKLIILESRLTDIDISKCVSLKSVKIEDSQELTQINLPDNLDNLELIYVKSDVLTTLNKKIKNLKIESMDIYPHTQSNLENLQAQKLEMSYITLQDNWNFNLKFVKEVSLSTFYGSGKINFNNFGETTNIKTLSLENVPYIKIAEPLEIGLTRFLSEVKIIIIDGDTQLLEIQESSGLSR